MTASEQRIEIPLSKQKMLLMLTGSLAFVAAGFWFVMAPPVIANAYWGTPENLRIVGYVAIVFFGLGACWFIYKLPDKSPGLVIDNNGLLVNSGAFSVGQILWAEIERVTVVEIHTQKMILFHIKNPEDYIEKQTNVFKRKMMTINYKMYGAPLGIGSGTLKISVEELYYTLNRKLSESRQ